LCVFFNDTATTEIYTPYKILIVVKLIRMRQEKYVASIGLGRGACGLLVGNLEGKRTPERRGHRGEDNMTSDLQEAE
jgi:hypothetical protein